VSAGREYLLDVAHNPAAVQKMVEYSSLTHCKGKTISLFSVMADKDIEAMIAAAGNHFEAWFVAGQPDNPRAASGADIAAALYAAGQAVVSVSKNLRQALRRAQGVMRAGDRLVVFGSFTTVAGVLPLLETGPGGMQESL
ncbi:MAG: bifunctional tetrahydrofolate synthase/dihydrofolate synthase, partial [Halieaceae bacterium]|nr:bifunctional tetrahydrofolate synthase/dihydrofolate synthase [Halieaceae bacterium]